MLGCLVVQLLSSRGKFHVVVSLPLCILSSFAPQPRRQGPSSRDTLLWFYKSQERESVRGGRAEVSERSFKAPREALGRHSIDRLSRQSRAKSIIICTRLLSICWSGRCNVNRKCRSRYILIGGSTTDKARRMRPISKPNGPTLGSSPPRHTITDQLRLVLGQPLHKC